MGAGVVVPAKRESQKEEEAGDYCSAPVARGVRWAQGLQEGFHSHDNTGHQRWIRMLNFLACLPPGCELSSKLPPRLGQPL